MAEARQAVAFQFAVTDEGLKLHVDRSAIRLATSALWRLTRRQVIRTYKKIIQGVFPATPYSLVVVTGVTYLCYYNGYNVTCGVLPAITQRSVR